MSDFINNVSDVDKEAIDHWVTSKIFKFNAGSNKPPYSILMPSPNVTGHIHVGHGLNLSLHDVIARYKRMQGYEVFFPPGLDHGGIATQCTVERQLESAGEPSRADMGRDSFVKRMEKWKDEKGNIIFSDMRKMGLALSWESSWYTMDEARNNTVSNVFVELYNKGILYRNERVVNWCPRCESSLSDMEVMVVGVKGKRITINVPVTDSDQHLDVTTTRPENLLACMAVGIGDTNLNYSSLIGKTVTLPIVNRNVPVIRISGLNTGEAGDAVLVCPSHSVRDYRLSIEQNLDHNHVFGKDGRVTSDIKEFDGLTFSEARDVVTDLLQSIAVAKVEDEVDCEQGKCYRCGSGINHRLSKQWYMRTDRLATSAIDIVETGEMQFNKDIWKNQYLDWMNTVETKSLKKQNWKEGVCVSVEMNHDGNNDWVISRQIWWGHRVPVWFCVDCDEMHVTTEKPGSCKKCYSESLNQDEDVLDMWFSCATWPLSVVEWPAKNELLERFFPIDLTVIGHDVLLFWVTATNMISLNLLGKKSFNYVYVHGLLTDKQGQKMAKSLGNVINVHEVLKDYGIDAFRDTLLRVMTGAQEKLMLNLDKNNFAISRKRVIELYRLLDSAICREERVDGQVTSDAMDTVWEKIGKDLDEFNIPEALQSIDEELNHVMFLQKGAISKNQAIEFLKLYHPFYPVLTETIWRERVKGKDGVLAAESWGGACHAGLSMVV